MYGRLPDVVREFHAARPAIDLRLRELPTGEALDALAEGRIDVGVVRPAQVPPGVEIDVVQREKVVAALPAGHPLAEQSRVALADLGGEAFVLLARREAPGLHASLTRAMADFGVAPREVQEVSELRTVIGLVSAGVGVSLVPASVSTAERAGVVFRPLKGRAPTVELALAWRAADAGSPVLAAFLELAHDRLSGVGGP
jgi:DNA-binding transcriptional LysR family regulator